MFRRNFARFAVAPASTGSGLVLLDKETYRLAPQCTVATLTFNHPSSRNAMTEAMGIEFQRTVRELATDTSVKAVVLTGAGQAFSAGGDVNFLAARLKDTPEGNIRAMLTFYDFFLSLRTLPVPVVAAINGHAIGAGFCVTLGCDVRVAAAQAKVSCNFARIGIHPGMGATYFVPRLVGVSHASKFLLTGETVSTEEAKTMGLVAAVVPAADVVATAVGVAKEIATASPIAVRTLLQTLRGDDGAGLKAALRREAEAQADCYAEGKDLREALNAIKEKRAPKFF